MTRMLEMARSHVPSFYARLKPESDGIQPSQPQEPLLHNLDNKKLIRRCCFSIFVAFLIAFALWVFDPPAGHEQEADPDSTKTQLKFVALVHRHGARSALHHYQFEEGIDWEVPPGKLLNVGFRNGFRFGRELRAKYSSGPGSLTPSTVKTYSTDVHRTVDTVHSVLIGLFTDNQTKLEKPNCKCRPDDFNRSETNCIAQCIGVDLPQSLPEVKIWDKDSGNDVVLAQYQHCEAHEKYVKKLRRQKTFGNRQQVDFQKDLDYLEKIIGGKRVNDTDKNTTVNVDLEILSKVWDTTKCLEAQNGSENGPYQNLEEITNRLENASTFVWHQLYSTEIGPQVAGIFLGRIFEDLKNGTKRLPQAVAENDRFARPQQDPLMVIYSAHDSTLASLMAAMKYENWHFPYFLSHIVFELYGPKGASSTDPESHYVQVLYNDQPLVLGNCKDAFCPLLDFIEPLQDRTRTARDCIRTKE